jgi:hypothetical protein
MELNHYANDPEFIKDMQTLSYEQRRGLFLRGANRIHGPNPLKGAEKSQVLALLYGIEYSLAHDKDADVQQKTQADWEKLQAFLKEERA